MDKINFMISSFLSLLLLVSFASSTPNQFQSMTGIETDRISKINFTDFNLNQNQVESELQCPRINFIEKDNLVETNGTIEKEFNSSIGWVTVNTTEMTFLTINANQQEGFFQPTNWIIAEGFTEGSLTITPKPIDGSNNKLELTTNQFGYTEYVNITVYNDDAEIQEISNQCLNRLDSDSESGIIPEITTAVGDSVRGFTQVIGGFASVINSIITTLFVFLTAKGNEISVTIMKIFVGAQVVVWLYILADFIKDVIPFT